MVTRANCVTWLALSEHASAPVSLQARQAAGQPRCAHVKLQLQVHLFSGGGTTVQGATLLLGRLRLDLVSVYGIQTGVLVGWTADWVSKGGRIVDVLWGGQQ
jgi:hypothetical protein